MAFQGCGWGTLTPRMCRKKMPSLRSDSLSKGTMVSQQQLAHRNRVSLFRPMVLLRTGYPWMIDERVVIVTFTSANGQHDWDLPLLVGITPPMKQRKRF